MRVRESGNSWTGIDRRIFSQLKGELDVKIIENG
jgi:hypothetical protein